MRLFEKSTFEKVGNTITSTGKDGINKAKDVKDTVKIQMDIKDKESEVTKMYRDLGKAYYQAYKDNETQEFDQVLAINAAFEEITQLKASLDSLKGIKRCPSCGNQVATDAKFCPECGANCETPAEEVEGDVVEETAEEEAAEETAQEAEEAPAQEAASEETAE